MRFVCLLTLFACGNENTLNKTSDHGAAGDPDIEVNPGSIDFGTLGAGEIALQTFVVSNVGAEESILAVSGIEIGGVAGGFTIVTTETAFDLPGGEERTIEVAFTPEGAHDQRAEAIVVSDDPDELRKSVELLGQGLVPELQIDPESVAFGNAYVGCAREQVLTLTNIGTDDLVIASIGQNGDAYTLVDTNVLPLTLAPEAATSVSLFFSPTEEITYNGLFSVGSNEPVGIRNADVAGAGRYAAEYVDEFVVPVDPPADILFFVDQSCSMDDDQRSLASNFSGFINQLSDYTANWNVMVVNDDDGCSNSGVLTASSSNYDSQFEVAVGRGGGDFTEAGLIVTSTAIEKTDSGDCNERFLRDSAMLHIIMVSDEPEQSPRSWDTYVNQVIAKKGDASLVKFSAIAGDYPSGCSSSSNSADAGTGYYEAVADTGGVFLSICSNWASNVRTLADASVLMDSFALEHTPVVATLDVDVNGRTALSGWSYDAPTNSVIFEESAAPAEGDTVTISYAGLASCD